MFAMSKAKYKNSTRSSTRFSQGPRKKQGAMLYYQNLWNIPQVYKKQQNWFQYKSKTYSNEQGRPVQKYIMHKNTNTLWVSNTKAKTYAHSSLTEKEKEWQQNSANVFVGQNGQNRKKALCLIQKRYWFYDNAAPIPGVSFVKKRKMLQKKEMMAFKNIVSWLGIYSKKQIKALAFSKNWNTFLVIESMLQSNIRKGFMAVNAQERNTLAQSKNTTINGNFIQKVRSVNSDADLFVFKNTKEALQKVLHFYASVTEHKTMHSITILGSGAKQQQQNSRAILI